MLSGASIHNTRLLWSIGILGALIAGVALALFAPVAPAFGQSTNKRLVTIHDRGQTKTILTAGDSVRDALHEADIAVSTYDVVEPAKDFKLVTGSYQVNIYRARPITVIDDDKQFQTYTAASTSREIAQSAGIPLRDEDSAKLSLNDDLVANGGGLTMAIDRAIPISFEAYGETTTVYTRSATVADVLAEKDITLTKKDSITPAVTTPIKKDMSIRIWRDGTHTETKHEVIKHTTRKIFDANRSHQYKKVKTKGVDGEQSVTYEVVIEHGKVVKRQLINKNVTKKPVTEVVVVGLKRPNALTKSKGAHTFVDSDGISHRETYYDLDMRVVMSACGGGGYTIRDDGVKIDKDGYVLVAAHLGLHPRCSVVETSVGPGKVYDTGGFAKRNNQQYDIATDWTNHDGR